MQHEPAVMMNRTVYYFCFRVAAYFILTSMSFGCTISLADATTPSPSPPASAVPTAHHRHDLFRPPPSTPTSDKKKEKKKEAFYPHGRDRPHGYEIVKEELKYSGWRKVVRRTVSSPPRVPCSPHPQRATRETSMDTKRRTIDFDIVDQATSTSGAVIVFAWNSTSKTATIVREYMPGPHRVLSGLAAGIVEDDGKHHSTVEGLGEPDVLIAARYELEEEW